MAARHRFDGVIHPSGRNCYNPAMNVEEIFRIPAECGEAPVWHAAEQALYWADIPAGRLYRYDPENGVCDLILEDRLIGAITVQRNGSLLLLRDRGNVVCFRDGALKTVIDEIPGASAFNDAAVDPYGRVFSGTCLSDGRPGCLYRIGTDASCEAVYEGAECSNGIGFSPDRKTMYFTDSNTFSIIAFDYDEATGALEKPRPFAKTTPPAKPDGMAVDSEGCVWSTHWEGGCLVRYSPEGEELMTVAIPEKCTTSLTFGGPELNEIYVTTAPGILFRVTGTGVAGQPDFLSRVKM